MRVFLALIIGIILGAAGIWYYNSSHGRAQTRATGDQIQGAAESAGHTIEQKITELHLTPQDIKGELARTGEVVRRKAQQAGQAISSATADARITTAIKAKLLTTRDLPGLEISVNTTDGIVTLSGAVSSVQQIGKAMALAMDTDGVRQVISTLQVRAQKQVEPSAARGQTQSC